MAAWVRSSTSNPHSPDHIEMANKDDWRILNQEEYLMGVELKLRAYRQNPKNPKWDHDHCEFCNAKFMVGGAHETLSEGFTTWDDYRWICTSCFQDFKHRFCWVIVEEFGSGEDS